MAVKPAGGTDPESADVAATGLFRVPASVRPTVETLFRNTVEQAPVGIAFANRDGGFRHANLAFCAMLGYTVDQLRHASSESLPRAEDLAPPRAGLGRRWNHEVTTSTSSGATSA